MKKMLFLSVAILALAAISGFQCSSAEMTSAKMYMQRSEWASAETSLEQEVAKHPANVEAWYLLGRVRLEQKNYAGMNEAFSQSLAAGNQFEKEIKSTRLATWGQLFNKGVETYLQAKQAEGESAIPLFKRAIESFTDAIVINPDSASTYTNLGLAYLGLNKDEDALKSFETSLNKEKDAGLASSVGGMYLDRGRTLQAEAQSASGAKKDSLIALAKMKFDKAIAVLQQAREWDPEDMNSVAVLLDVYVTSGRTEEAMTTFRQAVEKNPNNRIYRYNYGVLLLKGGDHKGAIDQFEAAVVIDPKFEDALYNLGVARLQYGVKQRSEAENDPKTKGRGSKSYEEHFRKGRETLERLRDLKSADPDVWEALGQAYANLNMSKQASEAFAKADSLRRGK
jgi:tetratricopeptide (TPR) repeat protein